MLNLTFAFFLPRRFMYKRGLFNWCFGKNFILQEYLFLRVLVTKSLTSMIRRLRGNCNGCIG